MEENRSERSIGWLVEEIMKGSVEKNRNRQEQELIRRGEFRDRTERLVRNLMVEELDRAREEVLLELLEKKTNYEIERVDHGYKVTQEYVLVSDIEKELSKLTTK